jgi:uncharacterized membrane protein
MAGIGFELRNIIKDDKVFSVVKAYSYSALLSSGPWVSSIIAILIVGFLTFSGEGSAGKIMSYQLIITYAYAFASSILLTGFIQLPFTRFVADKLYQQREDAILPEYFGVLIAIIVSGVVLVLPISLYVFDGQNPIFLTLLISIFIIMGCIWIANILASSLKYYQEVFYSYVFSYGLIVVLSYFFGHSIEMLMAIFLFGNIILFMLLSSFVILSYPSKRLVSFEFFTKKRFYWFLAFSGLFYNLGVWIDKFIFWYHPLTGTPILGKMNGSVVYDIPIFMAYLTIVPGMAIFFFRLEAYFSEKYDLFFDAVKNGGTLNTIKSYKNDMIEVMRQAIREVIIIQSIINIMIYLLSPRIFEVFNIPLLYTNLFYIDMVGAQLQLGFMSVLAMLYYLDKRKETMWLSLIFLILNGLLSYVSIYLGPAYFGYGYAVSLLIVFILSLIVVRNKMEDIIYETFLLR